MNTIDHHLSKPPPGAGFIFELHKHQHQQHHHHLMEPNVSMNGGTSSGNYNHGNQLQMPNNLMLHNNNNSSQGNPSDDKSNKTNIHVGASPTSLQNLMNFADGIQFSDEEDVGRSGKTGAPPVQLQLMGENNEIQESGEGVEYKSKSNGNKRKRPRTMKSTEEVESQRMIHIAVERNRRKQMNEHLNVLKSLMPRSYVQRGDQASIIGGAIEFVKELEQLLQCLESQKRRRLYGDEDYPKLPVIGESSNATQQQPQHQNPLLPSPFLLPAAPMETDDQLKFDLDYEAFQQLQEETAESKSFVADVQVKLLGLDIAMIKILSRRRHGQLINTIAALEKMQFDILQTNVTTIEQTVLYSFHVKVEGEVRYTAEDIANFVQQTFSFIHENTNVVM